MTLPGQTVTCSGSIWMAITARRQPNAPPVAAGTMTYKLLVVLLRRQLSY